MQLVCNKNIKIRGMLRVIKKFCRGFLIFAFLFLASCTSSEDNGINIVTTSNPNQNLVKYIAQDKVNLHTLTFNSSSHSFEFKPEDIKKIEDADIVFYNGLGLDEKVLEFSNSKKKFVQTTKNAELIEISDEHSDNHNHGEHNYDPHVWLSLKEYKTMGKVVLDELIKIDSSNKEFYTKNYNDLVKRADSMYSTYKKDFDNLKNREFVSNHASYKYLARDFGILNSSIYDVNNHGEANPRDIETIIDAVKTKDIKLIIGDEFDSNKELEVISNETGVNYKLVNNLERSGDFFTEYEKLLSSIYDGLK